MQSLIVVLWNRTGFFGGSRRDLFNLGQHGGQPRTGWKKYSRNIVDIVMYYINFGGRITWKSVKSNCIICMVHGKGGGGNKCIYLYMSHATAVLARQSLTGGNFHADETVALPTPINFSGADVRVTKALIKKEIIFYKNAISNKMANKNTRMQSIVCCPFTKV